MTLSQKKKENTFRRTLGLSLFGLVEKKESLHGLVWFAQHVQTIGYVCFAGYRPFLAHSIFDLVDLNWISSLHLVS